MGNGCDSYSSDGATDAAAAVVDDGVENDDAVVVADWVPGPFLNESDHFDPASEDLLPVRVECWVTYGVEKVLDALAVGCFLPSVMVCFVLPTKGINLPILMAYRGHVQTLAALGLFPDCSCG